MTTNGMERRLMRRMLVRALPKMPGRYRDRPEDIAEDAGETFAKGCRMNDEMPDLEFGVSIWRRASKQHVCAFCNRPIEKGDVYVRRVEKVDGEIHTYKVHTESGICADYDYEEVAK